MKMILALVLASFTFTAYAAQEKKVCNETVRKGKTVKECKTIKVHKKLEGTKVPEKPTKK
jgi:hypothetical protein